MEDIREDIVVVWFKRDLRLIDHAPIAQAQKENLPILFIYCFEPSIMQYDAVHVSITDYEKGTVSEKCKRFITEVNKIK